MKTEHSKKEKQKELLSQLYEKIINYMIINKPITIHLHVNKVTTRMTVIPDEVNFNDDELYIEYKSYVLSIDNKINHIQYIDTYEYDGYFIKVDNTEIFFDFI